MKKRIYIDLPFQEERTLDAKKDFQELEDLIDDFLYNKDVSFFADTDVFRNINLADRFINYFALNYNYDAYEIALNILDLFTMNRKNKAILIKNINRNTVIDEDILADLFAS